MILLTILTRMVCVTILGAFLAAVGLVITSTIREYLSDVVHCYSCGRAYRNPSRIKRIDWYLNHDCINIHSHTH